MTDLRTAAQQALEALDEADTFHRNLPDQRARRLAAMAALRAALAQQAEPLNLRDPAVRKRLATQWGYVPAAQESVPAAVVGTQSDRWRGYNGQWAPPGEPIKMVQMLRDLPTGTLLYTAPPQRKPLTEEVAALTAQRDALLEALKMIAGETPCFDNLMGDKDIARLAIKAVEETK